MGIYTTKGSAELDQRIAADLKRIAEVCAPYSTAGILLGGYGRGEGTPFIQPDGSQAPFNDYDLVVIVEQLDARLRQMFKSMERRLTSELGLAVDLYPIQKSRLPRCEFSLLNCEMKHGHKVVWGDARILDAMPDLPIGQVPLSEGSRLLLNRGKLLLDIKLRLAEPTPLTEEEAIRFLKFIQKAWLAIGDSALLAGRQYEIAYAVKHDRINTVGEIPHRDQVVEQYRNAVELKNWGDYLAQLESFDASTAFQQVRDVFLDFFAWYRKQNPGRECSAFKAILLNLKWNGRPLPRHPRAYLYDALQELLQDKPNEYRLREMMFCRENATERFYAMQARFS